MAQGIAEEVMKFMGWDHYNLLWYSWIEGFIVGELSSMALILKVVFFILISTFSVLSSTNENQEYRITVLATNISNYGGIGEWSFAALYESNEESLLFDTGFDKNTVLHNAQLLKDLSKVEKVVLSHFHSDHTGGLLQLRKTYKKINPKALSKVYVAKGFLSNGI